MLNNKQYQAEIIRDYEVAKMVVTRLSDGKQWEYALSDIVMDYHIVSDRKLKTKAIEKAAINA